jgi:hypothetical protein
VTPPAAHHDASSTAGPIGVVLSAKPSPRTTRSDDIPIACTLATGEMEGRIADWQETLHVATARESIDGGVRVHPPRSTPIVVLAALVEAEQSCCRFFTFTLRVGIDAVTLDVTAPDGAEDIVHALVGAPIAATSTPSAVVP